MRLAVAPYLAQQSEWPSEGRHIMAQYDAESVIVYQAYRPAIGDFAAKNGYFGGEFSTTRMSWIKPNFLWMMYRSGWGSKDGQEVVLAVKLKRSFFDQLLAMAVHSSFIDKIYNSEKDWQQAVKSSCVRLQWDPDHDPAGEKLTRRAIQLGLRDQALIEYSREAIIDIEDISRFVAQQRPFAQSSTKHCASTKYQELITPLERVYPVNDVDVINRLAITKDVARTTITEISIK